MHLHLRNEQNGGYDVSLVGDVLGKKPAKTPDPYVTAGAQTASNQQTANYNADLNRVSQYTPFGSSVYTQDGSTGSGAPNYKQTISLTPEAQAQLDNQLKQNTQLSNLGFGLADQAGSNLSKPMDTSGLPALSGAPTGGDIQSSYGGYGNVQSNLGNTGNIQTSLDYSSLPQLYGGNDFQQSAKDTQNAVYQQAASRLDPQWTNTQNQQDAKLANQGVMFGTGAYGKAQTQLDQAKNDAYNQANYSSILAGSNEQQRLFQDSLAQRQQLAGEKTTAGNFANSAQAQKYAQALSSGGFANSAQQQAYNQSQGNAAFANAAQSQKYGQDMSGAQFGNQARAQGLTEAATMRDMPLNELNALRSATQINNPQFSPVPQSNANGTDISGNIYKSAQMQNDNFNNMMNGIYSMAASAAAASDRRLKRNIRRVGTTAGMKLPLYAYEYVWDRKRTRVGVMADEVAKVMPQAIIRMASGYMAVEYGMIS